ncbi:MBL fold metallo-hydrolase [Haloarchaeobius baliensis]|uniref:MBL fold metallo-hydrolase n=1 Tax=Haloarchaeobius baliensis TaxID=1670458 RepID=UPI003F882D00
MSDIATFPVEVPTRAPSGRTNTYLVGDDPAVLVDPAARSDELDAAVAERSVGHVVVTHTHVDHVGAVAAYAAETGATVWARHGREERFADATDVTPDGTLRDGDVLPGTDVRVVETPGHAPDHLAFQADGDLVSGDLAVAEGSVVVGRPEGDLRAYIGSLRRVYARAPDRLFPGHGPVVDDPRATCARLIQHRLDREERVLAAVENGATRIGAVLDAAYDKDLTGVRDLALRTVECHLRKLAVEGRIRWDGREVEFVREDRE